MPTPTETDFRDVVAEALGRITTMPTPTETDFRDVLAEALAGFKGLGKGALNTLLNEYAPRFARLAAAVELDAARNEYQDLLTNLKLAGRVQGVRLEAATAKVVQRSLKLVADLALRYVGLPPTPAGGTNP